MTNTTNKHPLAGRRVFFIALTGNILDGAVRDEHGVCVFGTRAAAEGEIAQHESDLRAAVAAGYLEDDDHEESVLAGDVGDDGVITDEFGFRWQVASTSIE